MSKIVNELLSEDEIIARWDKTNECMISIVCITYNHARFIDDAIVSFLKQETTYSFEIIIHDDASTDNTRDVIEHYKEKYPNLIKVILQTENQYSKGNKPLDICFSMAKGKYIAICEGDDFWCDVKKLNKQVGFLEVNPEYIISCHNAFIIDENNNKINSSKLTSSQMRDFSSEELIKANAFLLTLTWVFRNIVDFNIPEKRKVVNGDTFMISVLGLYGKAKYHDDILPAAYRVHSGGVWSSLNEERKITTLINTWYWLQVYHKRILSGWDEYFLLLHFKFTLKRLLLCKSKASLITLSSKLLLNKLRGKFKRKEDK